MTPSEQARADALADAETLRGLWASLPLRTLLAPATPAFGLVNAGSVKVAIRRGHFNVAYRRAVRSARAAFRAVPGLREDK